MYLHEKLKKLKRKKNLRTRNRPPWNDQLIVAFRSRRNDSPKRRDQKNDRILTSTVILNSMNIDAYGEGGGAGGAEGIKEADVNFESLEPLVKNTIKKTQKGDSPPRLSHNLNLPLKRICPKWLNPKYP